MTALIVLVVLSAAPKDCSDLECFLKAAQTCGPSSYRHPSPDPAGVNARMGAVPKGSTLYTVRPDKSGACELETVITTESVELAPKTMSMLRRMTDGGLTDDEVRAQFVANMSAESSPGAHTRCVLKPKEIQDNLKAMHAGSYDSRQWQTCQHLGCGAVAMYFTAPGEGCAWSTCREGKRTLSCQVKGKEVACKPQTQLPPQLGGDRKPMPCVATCKKAGADPEVACR